MSKFSNSKIFITFIVSILFICLFASVSMAYTSTYTEPTGLLKLKSRGTGVKWLQDMLNHNGYNLTVDGIFGNNTYNAVRSFQSIKGLSVDGIVGNITRSALKSYSYTTYSNGLPVFNRTSTSLLGVIRNCKSYYANNNFYYSTVAGVRSIPADNSKLYNGIYCVDCSSYVSWTLYEYARANGLTSMKNYFSYQRNSATFTSIGANGGNDYLSVVSRKTSNSNVNLNLARTGDILVTSGHVEFLNSYTLGSGGTVTLKVYNCGSNASIKVNGVTTSATKNIGNILYILRVK